MAVPFLALVALIVAVSCVHAAGVNRHNRLSMVWFSFMLALLLWFSSEVAFSAYPLALGVPAPYPSIAAAFDLDGYGPALVGLLGMLWPFRESISRKTVIVVAFFGMALLGAIGVILLPLVLTYNTDLPALLVTLAHPVLDAATLAIAIVTLTVFLIGAFWRPLIFLILGMILTLVAHVMSGWTNLTHTYYYGHPLELILDWSFVSVALGFYLRRQQITSGAI